MPLTNPSIEISGTYFSRFLDTVGDGSGDKDAIGDYSAAATDFLIAPQEPDETIKVARVIVQIADTGTVDAGSYGNGIALTNGIRLLLLDGANIQTDYMDGFPVLTNGTWARVSYDVAATAFGAGENYVSVRWTFTKGGSAITLRQGQSLAMRLNDDFSNLNSHTFCVQGLTI